MIEQLTRTTATETGLCEPRPSVALAMNGEILPPDHGFPARLVVSGWLGAARIKWLGRIEVCQEALSSPWTTVDYVLVGPDYPAAPPARGSVINALTVSSLVEEVVPGLVEVEVAVPRSIPAVW